MIATASNAVNDHAFSQNSSGSAAVLLRPATRRTFPPPFTGARNDQSASLQSVGYEQFCRPCRVELLYREKCRKLRLQMVPGMLAEVRQKAQAELATVEAAWQIIRA